ncbi:MAG: hypothetical protein HRU41_25670 [Saprospiraceae bacterium]|nr:hypothetical protein [Saprospiraceae bacterium]
MKKSLLFVVAIIFMWACSPNASKQDWVEKDLLQYGIPMTILAPDSAEVNSSDLGGLIQDVTIKQGDDYYVQIYASDAETTDIARVKSAQLSEVKSNRYFSKIIQEETEGFIYETAIDSSLISYGFRYVRVQGDKEYIFQTGLVGNFSLEQVEKMYESVKQ